MAGEIVKGKPPHKVDLQEKLVIVGHGNGFHLLSHGDAHKDLIQFTCGELADYLVQDVLPVGYRGEIVVGV